jgi:hypothetical protein
MQRSDGEEVEKTTPRRVLLLAVIDISNISKRQERKKWRRLKKKGTRFHDVFIGGGEKKRGCTLLWYLEKNSQRTHRTNGEHGWTFEHFYLDRRGRRRWFVWKKEESQAMDNQTKGPPPRSAFTFSFSKTPLLLLMMQWEKKKEEEVFVPPFFFVGFVSCCAFQHITCVIIVINRWTMDTHATSIQYIICLFPLLLCLLLLFQNFLGKKKTTVRLD